MLTDYCQLADRSPTSKTSGAFRTDKAIKGTCNKAYCYQKQQSHQIGLPTFQTATVLCPSTKQSIFSENVDSRTQITTYLDIRAVAQLIFYPLFKQM